MHLAHFQASGSTTQMQQLRGALMPQPPALSLFRCAQIHFASSASIAGLLAFEGVWSSWEVPFMKLTAPALTHSTAMVVTFPDFQNVAICPFHQCWHHLWVVGMMQEVYLLGELWLLWVPLKWIRGCCGWKPSPCQLIQPAESEANGIVNRFTNVFGICLHPDSSEAFQASPSN